MIKGVSCGIQGFALYPAPSRADSWVVLIPFHHKYLALPAILKRQHK